MDGEEAGMVNVRYALPLEGRARALAALEREGAARVFGPSRGDAHVAALRWTAGGRPGALRSGLERLLHDFGRSGDPSTRRAVV